MSSILTAKSPDLSMLMGFPQEKFDYPLILDKNKNFYVQPNNYILKFGGGVNTYGVKPVSSTIIDRTRSLVIFLNFIEDKNLSIFEITDADIIKYVSHLSETRNIKDNKTTKRHVRVALDYILYLQEIYTDKKLITSEESPKEVFNIHITMLSYSRYSIDYIDHVSITNLVSLSEEVTMASDTQYYLWTDAIHNTNYHPQPSETLILRWESMSFLLEACGSRISELHLFTRTLIKNAYKPLADANKMVYMKDIPIKKGKYKGKTRKIKIANGTLQHIMSYINLIEEKWPDMNHEQLFVNVENGEKLAKSYFKKYSEKVVNNSIYSKELADISNHSFRHRFITLRIVQTIKNYSNKGSFTNLLKIAMKAVRKLTMHANDDTLSEYVHLAMEYIDDEEYPTNLKSAPDRLVFTKIKDALARFQHGSKNAMETISDIDSAMQCLPEMQAPIGTNAHIFN